jgi:NADP-dependent aldehyde dehydrogenase
LFDLAVSRPDPIPFYGELGSLNMVLVTANAVRARGADIAKGFVQSFTLGAGQFCTKPGVVFIPRDAGFEGHVAAALGEPAAARMLSPRIAEGFQRGLKSLERTGRVERLAGADAQPADNAFSAPVVFATDVADVIADPDVLLAECFGPSSILIRYDEPPDLDRVLDVLPGSLTATLHGEMSDAEPFRRVFDRLRGIAGRVIWNGWPTGVAVTWSMHHGGPWPATTSPLFTSVGATAIRRFLRPLAYQNVPEIMLPPALQENNPLRIPRRVDGRLISAG